VIEFKAKVRVTHVLGLHARPGVTIVKCAQKFQRTELELRCLSTNSRALGHSLLSILSLGAGRDSEIELICRGPRADELLKAVRQIFESGFADGGETDEEEYANSPARNSNFRRVSGG
jgi:phosphocarrier protein